MLNQWSIFATLLYARKILWPLSPGTKWNCMCVGVHVQVGQEKKRRVWWGEMQTVTVPTSHVCAEKPVGIEDSGRERRWRENLVGTSSQLEQVGSVKYGDVGGTKFYTKRISTNYYIITGFYKILGNLFLKFMT